MRARTIGSIVVGACGPIALTAVSATPALAANPNRSTLMPNGCFVEAYQPVESTDFVKGHGAWQCPVPGLYATVSIQLQRSTGPDSYEKYGDPYTWQGYAPPIEGGNYRWEYDDADSCASLHGMVSFRTAIKGTLANGWVVGTTSDPIALNCD